MTLNPWSERDFRGALKSYRRQLFLIDPEVRSALRAGIEGVRQTLPFVIDAWVLLPDHMHCIWSLPDGDADFSTRWRIIKTTVTPCCGERLNNATWLSRRRIAKGQSTLWQQRFWGHLIRDERDFAAHVDYIHWPLLRISATAPALPCLPPSVAVACTAEPCETWPCGMRDTMALFEFPCYGREGVLTPAWAGEDLDGEFGEVVG